MTLDASSATCHDTVMLSASGIKHKGLRRLATRGDSSKINSQWLPRVRRVLYALHAIGHPSELDIPGNDFHELKGDRKGTYSVKITGNYRITFRWSDDGPYAVDLEDYHG